ncbi:hypothetical protein QUB08_17630, partial [Microcoleus sp. BR0-C5]|uniref:hypothetical protein n=1 Tax=Microcoleus sp. BR0-C5 TaxID=2818713 RepID=UPI002FD75939
MSATIAEKIAAAASTPAATASILKGRSSFSRLSPGITRAIDHSACSNPHSAVLALMTKDFHTFTVGKISV